jgi:hypothetical protein
MPTKPINLFGSGHSDILWYDTSDGAFAEWDFTGSQLTANASYFANQIPVTYSIADARGDYNGDGTSDLLWRGLSDGQVTFFEMHAGAPTIHPVGIVPKYLHIIDGHGDYNGDHTSDILWRDSTSGNVVEWQMQSGSISSNQTIGSMPLNTSVLTADSDFNGDGQSDILWRDLDGGNLTLWQMSGTQIASQQGFAGIPQSYAVVDAHGDFNGDGKSDILFRGETDGALVMWQMNGASVTASQTYGFIPLQLQVIDGHGDYNGDGKSDILWRNNQTGEVVEWTMNGVSPSVHSLGVVPLYLTVVDGHDDFTGDGKSDILWRNEQNGDLVLWAMNGTSLSVTDLGANPPNLHTTEGSSSGLTSEKFNFANLNSVWGTTGNDTIDMTYVGDAYGNGGANKFLYDTVAYGMDAHVVGFGSGAHNFRDFHPTIDTIVIDHSAFRSGPQFLQPGTISASQFDTAGAANQNTFFEYNQTNGSLYYIDHISGTINYVLLANVYNHAAITEHDLLII